METATMEDVGDHGLYDRFELDGETFRRWHSTGSIECMSEGVWRSMPEPAQVVVRNRWMRENATEWLSDGSSYRKGLEDAHAAIGTLINLREAEYSALPMNFWGGITAAHNEKAAEVRALGIAGTAILEMLMTGVKEGLTKPAGSKDEVG